MSKVVQILYVRCPFCGSLRRVDKGGINNSGDLEFYMHRVWSEGRGKIKNQWVKVDVVGYMDSFVRSVIEKAKIIILKLETMLNKKEVVQWQSINLPMMRMATSFVWMNTATGFQSEGASQSGLETETVLKSKFVNPVFLTKTTWKK
jgi:hypothetical protein